MGATLQEYNRYVYDKYIKKKYIKIGSDEMDPLTKFRKGIPTQE